MTTVLYQGTALDLQREVDRTCLALDQAEQVASIANAQLCVVRAKRDAAKAVGAYLAAELLHPQVDAAYAEWNRLADIARDHETAYWNAWRALHDGGTQ